MNIEYLKKCDEAYHNTGQVLISDTEYDRLKAQLREEFPNDPYFQTVGAKPTGSTVSLPHVLGSLNKVKPDGTLLKWCKDNGIEEVAVSDKLDGVSIYAMWEDGKLVKASTRGDGYEGRDITDKMMIIQPTIANSTGIRELRGEAVMTSQDCEIIGYSLPRSAVSGILNGEEQEHLDKCQFITAVWYQVLGEEFDSYEEHFKTIFDHGLYLCNYRILKVDYNIETVLQERYIDRKLASRFDIDGLVVSNLHDATVGEDYYPANMVAFKVNESAVEATVTDVVWEIKRSGKLQPVVHFEEIVINGSKISKATGFNYKFIVDNGICRGAKIGIVKSGDIIPYITECYSLNMSVDAPVKCPSCGEKLNLSESSVDLYCHYNDTCPGQQVFRIEHFLLAHEVEEVTATTIRKLGVTCIEDLYGLSDLEISSIEGMGLKRANVILNELQKTLNTTPEKLLKSFGISGIGNTASNLIINKFGDFDSLLEKTVSDFIELDGIGDVLANNLVNGLAKNISLYNFLKEQGLKFESKAGNVLQGKLITLTGKSELNRNDLTKMIVSQGGMVKGISKKVDFLVTNDVDSQSSKMKKARSYGIEIITYEELLNIIR